MTVRFVIESLIGAIESKQLDAVASCLTYEVTWANVPNPPAVGRDAVCSMLGAMLDRASEVRWEIVSAAFAEDRGHLERLDRFRIGAEEIVAPCHGVFVVDLERGRVREVRDYVDLTPWRAALAALGPGSSTTTEG